MDIVNFDGLKAQGKVLDILDVDPNEDYFLIGKFDKRAKEFKATNYPIFAIKAGDVMGGASTLQQVTDLGNTTTNDIRLTDGAKVAFFSDGGQLVLNNDSRLRQGTIDAGLGGNKGIAQICAVGYELKWEAGRLYVMDGNGIYIRWSLYNFNVTPTVNDDVTKGYYAGSKWSLDDGSVYVCLNATTSAAVWLLQSNAVPTLQQVLDFNHDLVDDNNFQGTSAGVGNIGGDVIALGFQAALNNEGNKIIALGANAANGNKLSDSFIISNNTLPSYANFAAASAAITVLLGASPGSTYLYHDQATNSIGAVRL